MKDLPWSARIYIALLTALAASAVFYSVGLLQAAPGDWLIVLLVAVAVGVLDAFPIAVYGERIEITISTAVKFAVVLLYAPPVAILGTALGTALGEVAAKRSMSIKKVFNVAVMIATITVVAAFYALLHDPQSNLIGSTQSIAAVALAGVAGFAANSMLVSLVISLAAHIPFRYLWWRNAARVVWHDLSMVPLGAFLAVLWQFNPLSVLLAGLPLLVVRHAYKTANDLQQQTGDALHALMRIIDERDPHTFDHSERVSRYARRIAEALDLPQDEIQVIASAALLHDLGKVGMSDEILLNPKQLNPEQRRAAQRHAEIGAELLSKFPLFERGADLVRHHHERYDGKGYPDGLMGEAIPIGARIIAIVDAYQAMREVRPYRQALARKAALAQLVEGSGSQFDPQVVDAFIPILNEETREDEPAGAVLEPAAAGAEGK